MAKPPVKAVLSWRRALEFSATSASQSMTLDGDSDAGPSPMQTLAFSIAACMAMDVVEILRKGRHTLTALDADVIADRAETHPRRFVRVYLKFTICGDAPPQIVERAIALSRDKYCSVTNSLRQDIEFTTSFEVTP